MKVFWARWKETLSAQDKQCRGTLDPVLQFATLGLQQLTVQNYKQVIRVTTACLVIDRRTKNELYIKF